MSRRVSRQHEAEQVLSTALQSAQTTEVSPAFVTSEIDHIRTEKTHALQHLQQVEPQAVHEMETLLQTTVELKKFKVGDGRVDARVTRLERFESGASPKKCSGVCVS